MEIKRTIHEFQRGLAAVLVLVMGAVAGMVQAAAPKAGPPAAKVPADPPAAKPGVKPAEELVPSAKPEDPVVAAVLATKPTTPLERVRAAELLVRLGRADLAKGFLKQVLEAKLEEGQLADLGVELGSVFFMRLAARQELAPEAAQVRDAVFGAMKARLEDPKRLEELIRQLQDASLEKRDRAIAGLREAHQAGAVALIGVLADQARQAEYPAVRAVLVQMGGDAVGPLLACLDASDDRLRAEAALLLARMDVQDAVLPLRVLAVAETASPSLRSAAAEALRRLGAQTPGSPREVAELLLRMAQDYYTGQRVIPADLEGRVLLWQWDQAKGRPTGERLPVREVRLRRAARWASQAYQLLPDDQRIRILYLASMLEEAKYAHGLDKPLPAGKNTAVDRAGSFGLETLEAALRFALESRHLVAAVGLIEVMSRLNPTEAVLRRTSELSPLVQALRSGDRRLRMTALGAIVGMRPTAAFPGSSYVVEALEFFAASQGTRRAMVVSPQTETCSALGGYLTEEGYKVDTARNGREALRLLLECPDYELVWVDAALRTPEPVVLVQQLRRDGRTADLLVGIFCNQEDAERLRQMIGEDARLLVFPQPYQAEAAKQYLGQMAAMEGPEWVGFEERQRQASQAMLWLAELAQQSRKLYDLHGLEPTVQKALYAPQLGVAAAKVLACLGTPSSQKTLVDFASRGTQPIELRQAAVEAFGQSVQKFGILLTTTEIEQQYDRYNASRHLPVETQKVLGRILDVIESAGSDGRKPSDKQVPQKQKPKE
ncbi:MAG TPA: hypothetical protein PLQ00_00545 [Thermoguttaceae bacterium]|nr:hypothetical protein [Thermoguttaceae bacterium]